MLRTVYKVPTPKGPFKSGYIYKFRYKFFKHDPQPTILYLFAIKGVNPETGHRHNYIQGVNLHYIPRQARKTFADSWIPTLDRYNGSIRLTWDQVTQKFPFMRLALRRYLLMPGAIQNLQELQAEKIYKEIVQSKMKDFSQQALLDLIDKYPSAQKLIKLGFDFGISGVADMMTKSVLNILTGRNDD